MVAIMDGNGTPAQVGGFLMALRTKGETVDEIEGLSRTALEMARPVTTPGPVVDTCGTGGDRSETFNISTLAAIVVAGAGVPVAKHGNRAASSHCGSADLLEALGVKIDLGPEGVERCLADAGIAFMFAPVFHPGAAHAASVRRELRVPTIFNFLGPLTNPARPSAQVVGVSDPRMLPLVAQVLARRGIRAKVFRGHDGLDELTVTGSSTVYETANGGRAGAGAGSGWPWVLPGTRRRPGRRRRGDERGHRPPTVGGRVRPEARRGPLNAGAALEVAGRAGNPMDGISVARESIDPGAAAAALERWVEVSQKVRA